MGMGMGMLQDLDWKGSQVALSLGRRGLELPTPP